MQPKSGYKTVTPIEINNSLFLNNSDVLSLRGMRVYFACFSLVAIREAANRSEKLRSHKGRGVVPSYKIKELSKLTGLSARAVKKELSNLNSLNILSFSQTEIKISKIALLGSEPILSACSGKRSSKRPIPVPRSMLRFLAKCEKASVMKTLLAYLLRGLSLSRTGEIAGKGSIKASSIAEMMSLSLRSVKSARKELIDLNIISADTGSHQWKLNKTGAYFTINLDWVEIKTPELIILCSNSVDNSAPTFPSFAPLPTEKCTHFAPPYKNKKTPNGSKYQEAQSEAVISSGVFTKHAKKEKPATLNNIQVEDLQSFYRTEELYHQAVSAHWIEDSEHSFLMWVSAAVRAKSQKDADQVRLFVAIVKRKLFHFITNEQEERARKGIQKFRYGAELPEEMRRLVA